MGFFEKIKSGLSRTRDSLGVFFPFQTSTTIFMMSWRKT